MRNKIMLDGDWSLIYVENKKLRTEKPTFNTIESLEKTGYNKVPAIVPGNLERDLFRAGVIEDLYLASNTIKYYHLEKLHMFYYRSFTFAETPNEEVNLHFEGIDTAAEIFLNGNKIGEVEDMFIPHDFEVSEYIKKGENEIIVHIIPAGIAARKYTINPDTHIWAHRTAAFYMRKAAHMYGWDIMPRIVSGGIWRSVWVENKAENRIDDVFAFAVGTDQKNNTAELSLYINSTMAEDETKDYSFTVTGKCGDHVFVKELAGLWHNCLDVRFVIENAKLWWPRNYGDPNVYELNIKMNYKGEIVDEYNTRVGLRMAELERTDITDKDGSGEFVFRINGKKIFAMGTNWVPADAIHSFDEERIPAILPMLEDIGCTIIRIWGGNVFESDKLYNYCDDHGIMIWHDFMMGCALYPQDEEFRKKIFNESSIAVKRLRNHPSIVLWAGDNECDEAIFWENNVLPNISPGKNALTRKVLPDVLRIHDQTRPYLPSSPYLSDEIYRQNKRYSASELHLWGPRDYFKSDFYKNSICHFASETGYHGCPSPDSLARFISPEQLWPWTDEKRPPRGVLWNREVIDPHPDWQTHASCVTNDGTSTDKFRITLLANQIITLFGEEPENGQLPLCVLNDLNEDKKVCFSVTDITTGEKLIENTITAKADSVTRIWNKDMLTDEKHFYFIEWEYDGVKGKNHYFTNIIDIDYEAYKEAMKKVGFWDEFEGFGEAHPKRSPELPYVFTK
ncbi:MAG: hypothetical protein E7671_04735 [Ruminococcaceae bacterium]|nr:hypothetical protein [Oscillospiraceae bacterium]